MARTVVSPQSTSETGVVATYGAVTVDGDIIPGDEKTLLHVKNGSGGSINVTIQTGATLGGHAVSDTVVAVAAGADKFIGPFPKESYNNATGADRGKVYVDYSAQTTITRAALSL